MKGIKSKLSCSMQLPPLLCGKIEAKVVIRVLRCFLNVAGVSTRQVEFRSLFQLPGPMYENWWSSTLNQVPH